MVQKNWQIRFTSTLAGMLFLLANASCGIDFIYLLPAAIGQLDLLVRSVPVEEALGSGTLTAEQLAKLNLVVEVRDYAEQEIGLNTTNTYELFFNAGDQPVAYNLSASRSDALEAHTWTFPVIGEVPYLGYFDFGAAKFKKEQLQNLGYDVYIYEIDAYNMGDFLPNPILSPMLDRDEVRLVEVVIHELLHSTIWRANDTTFNESLATFVGRQGAVNYYQDRYADQPERSLEVMARYEDEDRFADFALGLISELEDFYASDLSSEEKISGKEVKVQEAIDRFTGEIQQQLNYPENYDWVQDIQANNAYLLGLQRYHLDLEVFANVFLAAEGDWSVALYDFAQATRTDQDPYDYLRQVLDSGSTGRTSLTVGEPVFRGPCRTHLPTTLLDIH